MECCVGSRYLRGHEWKAEVPPWRAFPPAARQLGAGDLCRGVSQYTPEAEDVLREPDDATQDVLDDPYMSNMEEILFWVHTKRAPCLFNYDNVIKKQYEAAQNAKLLKEKSLAEAVPSPKKKKRKLSLLDDDCVAVGKQQNVYFDTSQQKQCTASSSFKSDTLGSDIDFNIKNSSIQNKSKRVKKQKSNRTLHKKNKVVTSTPLRRSMRRVKNGTLNSTQLNITFDTYNCSYLNGTADQSNSKLNVKGQRSKKSLNRTPAENTSLGQKNPGLQNKSKQETAQKEQFEDLSDVSGFTANYIRSTKLQSNSKPHRSLRSKSNRNLVKESQPNVSADAEVPSRTTMLVCVNKSVNATTELPNTSVLNCSTDSSQNVINLVTTKNNDKHVKVNKSTSLLKFVDAKTPKPEEIQSCEKGDYMEISPADVNISFQSRSTGNTRYPKRHKKNPQVPWTTNTLTRASLDKRKKINKDVELNDSERKENPDDATISKTRSGRSLTLALRQPENSLIVYSNSTEKVSTVNALNVASQPNSPRKGKVRVKRAPAAARPATSELRDSVRKSSGFAACFSDSDDDSDALKQRKFFC